MLRFTSSAATRREFLVRSAATAAGTFLKQLLSLDRIGPEFDIP